MSSIPLVTVSEFALIVIGVTIAFVVLVADFLTFMQLASLSKKQARIMDALGITDEDEQEVVAYRQRA